MLDFLLLGNVLCWFFWHLCSLIIVAILSVLLKISRIINDQFLNQILIKLSTQQLKESIFYLLWWWWQHLMFIWRYCWFLRCLTSCLHESLYKKPLWSDWFFFFSDLQIAYCFTQASRTAWSVDTPCSNRNISINYIWISFRRCNNWILSNIIVDLILLDIWSALSLSDPQANRGFVMSCATVLSRIWSVGHDIQIKLVLFLLFWSWKCNRICFIWALSTLF